MPVVTDVRDHLRLPPRVSPSLFKPKFKKSLPPALRFTKRYFKPVYWWKSFDYKRKAADGSDASAESLSPETPEPIEPPKEAPKEEKKPKGYSKAELADPALLEARKQAKREAQKARQEAKKTGTYVPKKTGARQGMTPEQKAERERERRRAQKEGTELTTSTGESTEQHAERLANTNEELKLQARKVTQNRRGWETPEDFKERVDTIVDRRMASLKRPKKRAIVEKQILNEIIQSGEKNRGYTEEQLDEELGKRVDKEAEKKYGKPPSEIMALAEKDDYLALELAELIDRVRSQIKREWSYKKKPTLAPKGTDKARAWQGLEPAERVEGEVSPHPEEMPVASTDQPNRFVPSTELSKEGEGTKKPSRMPPFIPPPLKGKPGSKPRRGETQPQLDPSVNPQIPLEDLPGTTPIPTDFGRGSTEHGTPFIPQPERGKPGSKPRHGETISHVPQIPLHDIPGTARPNPQAASVGYGQERTPSNQGGNVATSIPPESEDPLAMEKMPEYRANKRKLESAFQGGGESGWGFSVPFTERTAFPQRIRPKEGGGMERVPLNEFPNVQAQTPENLEAIKERYRTEYPPHPVDPISGKPITPLKPPEIRRKRTASRETEYIPFNASPKDLPLEVREALGVDWNKPLGRQSKEAKDNEDTFLSLLSTEGMPQGLVEGPPESNGDVTEGVQYAINKKWGKQVSFSYVIHKTKVEPGEPQPPETMSARELRETLLGMNPEYPIEMLPDIISVKRRNVFVATGGMGKKKRGKPTEALVMKMPAGSRERYMDGVASELGLNVEREDIRQKIQAQLANEDPMLFQYLLRKMGASAEEAAKATAQYIGEAETNKLFRAYRQRTGDTSRWFSSRRGAGEENAAKKRRMAAAQQAHETGEENAERLRRMQAGQVGGMERRRDQAEIDRRKEAERIYQQKEAQERLKREQGLSGGL
jgi:hypothetical protein